MSVMVRASITPAEWTAFRVHALRSNWKVQDLVAEAMRTLLHEHGVRVEEADEKGRDVDRRQQHA